MKFIIGNWKMNGTMAEKESLLKSLKSVKTKNKIIMCLPFTLLHGENFGINIGAQDISNHENGAYTGDISGKMLKKAGVKYVLVGHSERRKYHNETNAVIQEKATMAIKNGIIPIICIGETAAEKKSGKTMSVIKKMITECTPPRGKYIIAYEPQWAIGTGNTPTLNEIAYIFSKIYEIVPKGTIIIYGGSVNASNAHDISKLPHVDGLLVGGASLKSRTFLPIIKSVN